MIFFRNPPTASQPITTALSHLHHTLTDTPFYTAITICLTHIAVHAPTTHYLPLIIPHDCRLTIVPFLSLSLLTRSGWLACARDDFLLWGFCSYVAVLATPSTTAVHLHCGRILHRSLLCLYAMTVWRRARTVPLSTSNSCILLTKLQVPPPLDVAYSTPPPPPLRPHTHTSQHSDTVG